MLDSGVWKGAQKVAVFKDSSTCDFGHKNFIIRLFALEHFFGGQNIFLFDYRRQPVQGIVAVFRFVSHFSWTKISMSI